MTNYEVVVFLTKKKIAFNVTFQGAAGEIGTRYIIE